jgi:CheY-like chemotaxis protein
MRTVLIVDDDLDLRDTLTEVLADEGYGVASAADGLAALEYLATHDEPGVILLDWMMPRMNGAEFRARQLQDPRIAAIPVVLLTADARVVEKQSSLSVHAFLAKPVRLDALLEVIDPYCR